MNLPFNFGNLFSFQRFIDWRPSISKEALIIFLFCFAFLLMVAVILKIIEKKKNLADFKKKLIGKYFNLFLIISLLGFFWTWCRYERVVYFSARLWLLALVLLFLFWLAWIIRYQIKVVPEARKRLEQKQIFEKYLPKKK